MDKTTPPITSREIEEQLEETRSLLKGEKTMEYWPTDLESVKEYVRAARLFGYRISVKGYDSPAIQKPRWHVRVWVLSGS